MIMENIMMAKLIVIEGSDGVGKATQSKLLAKKLRSLGFKTEIISFPNYGTPGAKPLEMYLKGDFGSNPNDMNPYMASMFFALDRLESYKHQYKILFESNDFIIADRYVESNLIYQGSKLNRSEQLVFARWLFDLEYKINKLPKPDYFFYLSMNSNVSKELRSKRTGKTGGTTGDIHENNEAYLNRVQESWNYFKVIIEEYVTSNVYEIESTHSGNLLSKQEIHKEIIAGLQYMNAFTLE